MKENNVSTVSILVSGGGLTVTTCHVCNAKMWACGQFGYASDTLKNLHGSEYLEIWEDFYQVRTRLVLMGSDAGTAIQGYVSGGEGKCGLVLCYVH